jgi:hypothetical protein
LQRQKAAIQSELNSKVADRLRYEHLTKRLISRLRANAARSNEAALFNAKADAFFSGSAKRRVVKTFKLRYAHPILALLNLTPNHPNTSFITH